jgi:hypothetical protein
MNVDFLEILESTQGPGFIRDLSAQLGESELAMWMAVRSAGPALLSGLMQRVATPGGASEIYRQVTHSDIDAGAAGKFAGTLAKGDTLESLLRLGQALDRQVFGARSAAITHALADSSGIRTSSALAVLSMTAPLLFGLLKKHASGYQLDAAGLGELLLHQQQAVGRSGLDHRLAGALGFGSLSEMLATLPDRPTLAGPCKPTMRVSERSWLPWSAAAAISILGVVFLVSRTSEQQELPRGAVKIAELDMAAPTARSVAQQGDDAVNRMAETSDTRELARERTRADRDSQPAAPDRDVPDMAQAR